MNSKVLVVPARRSNVLRPRRMGWMLGQKEARISAVLGFRPEEGPPRGWTFWADGVLFSIEECDGVQWAVHAARRIHLGRLRELFGDVIDG